MRQSVAGVEGAWKSVYTRMSVCGETIVRDFSDLVCLCELVEFCRVLSQSTAELWMRYDRKGEGRKNGITSSVPPC